jgi:hypothetical protein
LRGSEQHNHRACKRFADLPVATCRQGGASGNILLPKFHKIGAKKKANRISHRYNRLPLLPSGPGGVQRELVVWICRHKVNKKAGQSQTADPAYAQNPVPAAAFSATAFLCLRFPLNFIGSRVHDL